MNEQNIDDSPEIIAIEIAEPFPESQRGNGYLFIAMEYFTKWPKVLVSNFRLFGVLRELHSYQMRNFESRLLRVYCTS
jgi:hypothetical protein